MRLFCQIIQLREELFIEYIYFVIPRTQSEWSLKYLHSLYYTCSTHHLTYVKQYVILISNYGFKSIFNFYWSGQFETLIISLSLSLSLPLSLPHSLSLYLSLTHTWIHLSLYLFSESLNFEEVFPRFYNRHD